MSLPGVGKEVSSEKKGFLPGKQVWQMEQWGNTSPKLEGVVGWHWSWPGGSCQGGVAVFGLSSVMTTFACESLSFDLYLLDLG